MKFFQMYKSRKYFQRMLLSITLLMIMFMAFFSSAFYYNSESVVLDMQEEANKKVLTQMNFNIQYMNELVKNLATSTFSDNQILPLMTHKEIETFELVNKLRRLEKIVDSTTFLKSIVIYNGICGCYYSTASGLAASTDPDVLLLKDYIGSTTVVPKLKLIPMRMSRGADDPDEINAFSFFIYDEKTVQNSGQGGIENALIFNVKTEWLFDNMKTVNGIGNEPGNHIFIMDNNGNILTPNREPKSYSNALSAVLDEKGAANRLSSNMSSTFIGTFNGKKTIVTHLNFDTYQWKLVIVQPYEHIVGKLDRMRNTSIIVTLLFLPLTALLSLFISHKLYRPIETMMEQFRKNTRRDDKVSFSEKDELLYMSSVYTQVLEKMRGIERDSQAKMSLVKHYYVRKLIMDSTSITSSEMKEYIDQNHLQLKSDGPYLLAVLHIEHYSALSHKAKLADLRLYKFAIRNITKEIMDKSFCNETVDMRGDHLAVLISVDSSDWDSILKTAAIRLQEIQDTILAFYRISYTATISDPILSYEDITRHYGSALSLVRYRMVCGTRQIITTDRVKRNMNNRELHLPEKVEEKFIEELKAGNRQQIAAVLDRIFGCVSRLHADHVLFNMLRLSLIISNTMREMNQHRLIPIDLDLQEFNRTIMEMEQLDEIREAFDSLIERLLDQMKQGDENKHTILIDAIKEIIEEHYADKNLNLQQIASMVKMSPVYLGRMFRNCVGMSVADYINGVRLNITLEMLGKEQYNITDIMDRVGFSNQSSYFRQFKKKFGVTPKEYRVKQLLDFN
ncbi:AraC family transcriptional regulator [Paenibacillus radicis (ex Xue et al. 2023)]|uniref:AraC family transcriptional regulator n=1 Tax=Paenibacillus radicis (ex Xue et al. 2023) TaxID=2972489 RepID=A0ABT1YAV5_9BACL|nr:AraC family transcriptional regulator [Paenibacillus radicis (ex Xue et al. 2023)]MCR8630326.1 AraC family transcriptional regulator [Paenibacillus radicis (ex Xue et al. 2023)]